ncbi:MAG: bifunctional DNA primase/polymerase [Candidatus Diapherotrites archaeon]|nr:bifunctional DNA primase/polymerase [Candidatus Diapherotrites archaeon]
MEEKNNLGNISGSSPHTATVENEGSLVKYAKNLANDALDFIRVEENSKKPVEKEWQKGGTTQKYNSTILNDHITKGGNIGLLLRNGIIDFEIEGTKKANGNKPEEFERLISLAKELPKTLSFKTPSGGERRIYNCPELQKTIQAEPYLEIRGVNGVQSVIYGKTPEGDYSVKDDLPVSTITLEELMSTFSEFLDKEKEKTTVINSNKISLSINKVANLSNLKWKGKEYQGSHPVHGSTTGNNFTINPTKDTWYCFRHHCGGDALSLLAIQRGIITCEEASKKLRKEKFKKTLEIAKNEFGVIIPEENSLLQEVQTLDLIDFSEFNPVFQDTHSHLTNFDLIDNEVGLQGSEYYSVKKALTYYAESMRQAPICFYTGSEAQDNRFHYGAMIGPGKGKGKLKGIARANPLCSEINGARTNLEQLIGKIMYEKGGKEVENPGYFASVGLIADEAQNLLNEQDSNLASIMAEIRKALDPFTKNIPDKKLVNNKRALRYSPECRLKVLIHETTLETCFFDLGTFRRLFFFKISPKNITKADTNQNYYRTSKENMLKELYKNKIYSSGLVFEKKEIDLCLEYTDYFRRFLLNHPNKRAKTLGIMWHFSLPQMFFRMVGILAIARGETKPTEQTISFACFDCIQLLLETIKTYGNNSCLTLSRTYWKTTDQEAAMFLEWLYTNGATSESATTVTINEAIDKMANLKGINERQAKKELYKLQNLQGLIDKKQVGQHGSKVWITFNPETSGGIELADYPSIDLLETLKKKKDELHKSNVEGGTQSLLASIPLRETKK